MTVSPVAPLQQALAALAHGGPLDAAATAAAFRVLMQGDASPAQTAALLMGLRVRGETPDVVAGAATALREAMRAIDVPAPDALVDTCGTGGGVVTTFNISTAAALLTAGCGVRVAKHGNRSFTSACGSADVLEALGVAIELPVPQLAAVLAEAGIVFMFAPTMHPAMRHVGPVRREMAVPTVMNIVGPLANPARAGRQVVGVADASRVPLMAGALARLGSVHALVVHGAPGIDEVSPLGETVVVEVVDGTPREWRIDPAEYGLLVHDPAALAGGGPADNARIIEAVLGGDGPSGATAAVLLNAAAALYVAGRVTSFGGGVEEARAALARGAGMEALQRLRRVAPLGAGQ
jgi:anthranilate phosphoribosyltransferase